jgi:hypothetical protein
MINAQFLEFCALAFAVTGLAAVVWEIAARDSRLFGEILTDVRAMAESPCVSIAKQFTPAPLSLGECANSNELKKAA